MKKIFAVFLVCLMFCPSAVMAAGGKKAVCDLETYVFNVSGNSTNPPYSWVDRNERHGNKIYKILKGYAPSIAEKILKEIGFTYYLIKEDGDFETIYQKTKQGQVDLIYGVYFTDNPYSGIDVIYPPFETNHVAVLIRRDRPFVFANRDDLAKKKGVVRKDENFGPFFDKYIKEKLDVIWVENAGDAFEKLMKAEADYMITNRTLGHAEAVRYGIRPLVAFAKKDLLSVKMFFGLSKLSDCRGHKDFFKKRIEELKKDGTLDKLLKEAMNDWTSKFKGVTPEDRFRPVTADKSAKFSIKKKDE